MKWPYTYDSCDVGTLPNQTYVGQSRPLAAVTNGDAGYGGVLVSHQRTVSTSSISNWLLVLPPWTTTLCVLIVFWWSFSCAKFMVAACTCPGESHPGPMRKDGTYVGRSAPEIDVLEATIVDGVSLVCPL